MHKQSEWASRIEYVTVLYGGIFLDQNIKILTFLSLEKFKSIFSLIQ
jgi:hypothetical protein